MNHVIQNILAVLAGLFIGSMVNMGIIMISGSIIPPPEGVDVTPVEGLKSAMELFEPKHFVMPFLAHALGTFSGALVAALVAKDKKMKYGLAIGVVFFIGGLAMVFQIPTPIWFILLDLIVAYIPMSYFAGKLVEKKKA